MNRVGMRHDTVVKVEPGCGSSDIDTMPVNTPISAYMLLSGFVELQQLASRGQLHFLSKRASGKTKERLELAAAFEGSAYDEFVLAPRRTLLEILLIFPEIQVKFGDLLAILPRNKLRYYSISSSPKVSSSMVSITVSVVKGASPTGRVHLGMCSNFLKDQPDAYPKVLKVKGEEGRRMPMPVMVKDTGSSFRLPSKDKPIIMVGPGTGLAPMRGFIQERVADGVRDNLLFFGCRDETDYIYREELEHWSSEGFLMLHVAYSRKNGVAKTYVQHLIEQQAAQVTEFLKRGAHVYVCGDASKMAPDVLAAFACVAANSGFGEGFIDEMMEEGRYCQDVWAAQSI